MSSTLTVYTIKWRGPYKDNDLPEAKSNMIYLWTGKTGPKSRACLPCYCGITCRGTTRFGDKDHKKEKILKNSRKCWVGSIVGGKRKTSKGYKNTAFERAENLVVCFFKKRGYCSLNERKNAYPRNPVGVFSIFYKITMDEYSRRPKDISPLPKILLWNGEKFITG